MIKTVSFYGKVNENIDFYATVYGESIYRKFFMKETQKGVHFFSNGNELILTEDGIIHNCNGGQVSEYMFGASLPIEDLLNDEVLNRLVFFGAFENPKTHQLYFTNKISGILSYESIFLNGNALSCYFFFIGDPKNLSVVERQEKTLKALGKYLKRTEMVGRQDDTALMEAFVEFLDEKNIDIFLIRILNKENSAIYKKLKKFYERYRKLPDTLPEEESLDPYLKERLRIDVIYQDKINRSLIKEYKYLLSQNVDGKIPPSIKARLQRLRTFSVKHNIPSSLFDTLENIIFQGKEKITGEEEPFYISETRQILESFLLESGPFTQEITKEELVTLLFCKQRAVQERDNSFEEILLDVGRLIDEKVSQTEDFDLLESFGKTITYLDRFDSSASFINNITFMEGKEVEEAHIRSLVNNYKIFNELEENLFEKLFILPLKKNPYITNFGKKKLEEIEKGLKNIANNEATIQDLCFILNEINRQEEIYQVLRGICKERLKHFYVDLTKKEGRISLQREVLKELKKSGQEDYFDEGIFNSVIEKIRLESLYINEILPEIIEKGNYALREDFIKNTGIERFILEELEQEYFEIEKLDPSILSKIQATL
ncbi:MAG: TIGR04442 family protein [Thermoanaerobaculia bacterium]